MPIPSFDDEWFEGQRLKPRIQVLEIRDREKPDGEPIAKLLVERQTTYVRDTSDGPVYEASINLTYEVITLRHASKGDFVGKYSMLSGTVSLSSGAVFLNLPELAGQRIGTYLMNEIVSWAKRWPEATVNSVELMIGQSTEDNRERRNWFWEQFGLVFDYNELGHLTGRSRPMLVKDLKQIETWKQNITELRVKDFLKEQMEDRQKTEWEIDRLKGALQYRVNEIQRAEDRPVRWALRRLYYRFGGIVTNAAVLAVLALLFWMRFA